MGELPRAVPLKVVAPSAAAPRAKLRRVPGIPRGVKRAKAKPKKARTLVRLEGIEYNREMILEAKYVMAEKFARWGSAKTCVIVVFEADIQRIFEAACPPGECTFDEVDQATIGYLRRKMKFTDGASRFLRILVERATAARERQVAAAARDREAQQQSLPPPGYDAE